MACFAVHCSRHVHGHALEHEKATQHAIALSLADLSVWCYRCAAYIAAPEAAPVISALHEDKFGVVHPSALADSRTAEELALINGAAQTRRSNSATSASGSDMGVPIDTTELASSDAQVADAAAFVARQLAASRRTVWFTGAGLSTNASIPDFRGPSGVWTLQKLGQKPNLGLKLEMAEPTSAHRFIARTLRREDAVVSQNVDNLHRHSGVPAAQLMELHGNAKHEACGDCGRVYERDFDTVANRGSDAPLNVKHATGRRCQCGGALKDTIVSFGEQLPRRTLQAAIDASEQCDLFIVLGSSLRVSPASELPQLAKSGGANVVIVNKQPTPLDHLATKNVHCDIDHFLQLVAEATTEKMDE